MAKLFVAKPSELEILNNIFSLSLFFYLKNKQALGLRRDDTFSVTMLGHCIEMYIGDSEAYIGK